MIGPSGCGKIDPALAASIGERPPYSILHPPRLPPGRRYSSSTGETSTIAGPPGPRLRKRVGCLPRPIRFPPVHLETWPTAEGPAAMRRPRGGVGSSKSLLAEMASGDESRTPPGRKRAGRFRGAAAAGSAFSRSLAVGAPESPCYGRSRSRLDPNRDGAVVEELMQT